MTNRPILITGVTGQDGYYLANQLLDAGRQVFGFVRRTSGGTDLAASIEEHENFHLIEGDITDPAAVHGALHRACDQSGLEVYNLAAQSFVPESWRSPSYTFLVNVLGLVNILEAVKSMVAGRQDKHDIRVYQASSSEMYGFAPMIPALRGYTIANLMAPASPYGAAKLAAHRLVGVYRESYGMYVVSGICFNHESLNRGREFVTQKIACEIARLAEGDSTPMRLGNISARRDWGHAADYTRAMQLALNWREPRDWVIATGESHSVQEFLETAWAVALEHLPAGTLPDDWRALVEYDTPEHTRPTDIKNLIGDPEIFESLTGWRRVYSFEDLVREMVLFQLTVKGLLDVEAFHGFMEQKRRQARLAGRVKPDLEKREVADAQA